MKRVLTACSPPPPRELALNPPVSLPRYLEDIYWWAYLHPRAVRIFERQWLVNLILWGNYARLRDAALAELAALRWHGASRTPVDWSRYTAAP